ncbi:MAG TPA: hypothetical protein VKV05_09030 [Terriglobales bacterium]|nr:hypothetical protein [Terriglobales bacterium]
MTSIWVGLVVLGAVLMAADWYLWGPRYRPSGPQEIPSGRAKGTEHLGLRSAA